MDSSRGGRKELVNYDDLAEMREAIHILAKMFLIREIKAGVRFDPHPASMRGSFFFNDILDSALREAKEATR